MEISKGENTYAVTELRDKWRVSKEGGKLSLSFEVPKELCKTWGELQEYILSTDLF